MRKGSPEAAHAGEGLEAPSVQRVGGGTAGKQPLGEGCVRQGATSEKRGETVSQAVEEGAAVSEKT